MKPLTTLITGWLTVTATIALAAPPARTNWNTGAVVITNADVQSGSPQNTIIGTNAIWVGGKKVLVTGDAASGNAFTAAVNTAGIILGTNNLVLSATISNTAVSAGTYGSSNQIPRIIVGPDGRLTSVQNIPAAVASDTNIQETLAVTLGAGRDAAGLTITNLLKLTMQNSGTISFGQAGNTNDWVVRVTPNLLIIQDGTDEQIMQLEKFGGDFYATINGLLNVLGLDANGYQITTVGMCVNDEDAAPKGYVDGTAGTPLTVLTNAVLGISGVKTQKFIAGTNIDSITVTQYAGNAAHIIVNAATQGGGGVTGTGITGRVAFWTGSGTASVTNDSALLWNTSTKVFSVDIPATASVATIGVFHNNTPFSNEGAAIEIGGDSKVKIAGIMGTGTYGDLVLYSATSSSAQTEVLRLRGNGGGGEFTGALSIAGNIASGGLSWNNATDVLTLTPVDGGSPVIDTALILDNGDPVIGNGVALAFGTSDTRVRIAAIMGTSSFRDLVFFLPTGTATFSEVLRLNSSDGTATFSNTVHAVRGGFKFPDSTVQVTAGVTNNGTGYTLGIGTNTWVQANFGSLPTLNDILTNGNHQTFISVSVDLTATVTDNARVDLMTWLPGGATNSWGPVTAFALAGLRLQEQLVATLRPNEVYLFTNQSAGIATAVLTNWTGRVQ